MEIQQQRSKDMIGFEPIHHASDATEYYRAINPNNFQYDVVMKTIANGLSLRQAMGAIEDVQDKEWLVNWAYINIPKITIQVHICCVELFQKISDDLRHCWAFTIALD